MGTEGAAWKRCLRARILLRTLSFPEVFQHPVEYMAMERVIRRQGGMIEILGGEVVKAVFLMELAGLKGRERLEGYDVDAVITYPGK